MMTDKEIRKVVSLVMFFVRTRSNARDCTDEDIFLYVKDKLNEI